MSTFVDDVPEWMQVVLESAHVCLAHLGLHGHPFYTTVLEETLGGSWPT